MKSKLEEIRETIVAVDILLSSPIISEETKQHLQRYRSEIAEQLRLLLASAPELAAAG